MTGMLIIALCAKTIVDGHRLRPPPPRTFAAPISHVRKVPR